MGFFLCDCNCLTTITNEAEIGQHADALFYLPFLRVKRVKSVSVGQNLHYRRSPLCNCGPRLLAQLLVLLSSALEHDETGSEPRVALM